MPNFPHMSETDFPHLNNVNVYKYENELDYSRYDYTQMKLQMCCVPWDMGEAHVGQRTISGIGNVVYFGDTAKRDAWFAAIPDTQCIRFETKFKELHKDNEIVVPVPFDVAAKYNYLTVEYSLFANDSSPVEYETQDGLKKWFWFIREVEFVAPNATRLHLLNDAWQTFIYDVDIPYMVLERGHAPMFAIDADTYLANPLENSDYLLEPDSNLETVGEKVTHSEDVVFDDDVMYAVFVTSANVSGNWGTNSSNSWKTPASARYHTDGNLSYSHVAVPVADIYDFLVDVETQRPQFKQTVKCVYLLSAKLVTITATLSFAGHDVHLIGCTRKEERLIQLEKSMFGYDAKYAKLAKLYTAPYAHIEVTNEDGDITQIRIEDTIGTLDVDFCFNTAFPALGLNANIAGVGSASSRVIDFKNVGTRHFKVGGKWYDIQYDWAIPTFGVILEAAKEYDYSGYFERQQAEIEYTNAYNSEIASAETAKANGDRSANRAKSNTTIATTAQKDAASRENRLRNEKCDAQNDALRFQETRGLTKLQDDWDADKAANDAGLSAAVSQTIASAITNGAQGIAGSIGMGAITGGIAGAAVGAAGAAMQSIGTAAGTMIAITSDQNTVAIANNLGLAKWTNAKNYLINTTADAKSNNNVLTSEENSANTAIAKLHADSADDQATGTQTTALANNAASETTAKDNASRTRNSAINRVANTTRSHGMQAPYEFGTWSNAENANVKPKMLSANVVTQGNAGIAYAGDEFLRYGYRYNRNWDFNGNWCIGECFTYWKLSDFWVRGLNVPDLYMDKLRFFLFGGVTVWRAPEMIGNVSIYENW